MIYEILASIIFSSITTFREVLEAVLIVGIITNYLRLIDRKAFYRDVIYGVLSAIGFSIFMAWIFLTLFNDLSYYQILFEAIFMFLAAIILTWMILWMSKQAKNLRSEFQYKIDNIVTNQEKYGIILLVFFSVAREGAELVLLLYTSYIGTLPEVSIFESLFAVLSGFMLGLLFAIFIAYLLFMTTKRLDIKRFFQITSIILIIFAAGLFAHGFHELYEYLEITAPSLSRHFIWTEIWNINNTPIGNILQSLFGWTYDFQNPNRFEKSIVGSILAGLLGWNDNPALIEVLAYGFYYIMVLLALKKINITKKSKENLPDTLKYI